jgi:ribosomal-protein-serine acetyltransferase
MFTRKIDADTELRLIEPHHAAELNALVVRNFDHLHEWSNWLKERERPVSLTEQWVVENRKRYGSGDGYEVAIWNGGKMAGQIGFNFFDRVNRRTEIGYWLGKEFSGKGIVTRSCKAMIDYAFNDLSMKRVEIKCGTGNAKSRAIPERLGFRNEGVARQSERLHDRFIDLVVYAMLAEEWEGK